MMRNNPIKHRGLALMLAAGLAVFGVSRHAAAQVVRFWNISTSGNWSVPGNWNPSGVPAAGDGPQIVTNLGTSLTVTYDYTGPAVTLNSMVIEDQGTGTNTLSMAANTLTLANGEVVGNVGRGSFSQTGGNHSVGSLTVGNNAGSNGSFTLGSGASLSAASGEFVGSSGTGTFTQNGGTNASSNGLYMGSNPNSSGSYVLSGGAVNIGNGSGVIVASSGTASFTQTGGNLNAGSDGRIWIAASTGSHGVYNVSAGSASTGFLTVGGGNSAGGQGTLDVSGTASVTVTAELGVFNNNGSSINLSGGTITAADLNDLNFPSNFVWTGGTLNLTNSNITFDALASGTAASLGSILTLNSGQTLGLTNGNETIGGAGGGSLTLNGGSTNTVSGTTTINPLGTLALSGGTLNTSGTLLNLGTFTFNSGTLTGRLINQGNATLAGASNFSPTNGVENDSSMVVPAATLTVNGAGFDNLGTFSLNNGTIAGTATVTNDFGGVMSASGTISQGVTNNGTINLTGVLTSNGAVANNGVINVPSATTLRGSGAVANGGTINLSGGAVSSALTNNGGGVIQGNGALTNFQGNSAGGRINVPAGGGPLNITSPWSNSGLVVLQGGAAILSGGAITNAGTVQGNGQVSAPILNTAGAIQPTGGQLVLAGAGNTNTAAGQIQITGGNTLFVSQGLATNAGTIALSGGIFDNNNQPLTNNAAISGNGTIRTGGLTNSASGTISLSDVASSVLGTVANSGHINITSNTTTFYNAVTNNAGGVMKITTGTSRFLSTFTNNGTFSSDPATNYFQNLSVGPQGILLGGSGDQFIVTGDVINASTRNTAWNTAQALLELTGGPNHTLSVSGTDQGPVDDGFANNFSWGILQLDPGNALMLQPEGANAALYVRALVLEGGLGQLSSIGSNGVNVYYDPGNPANAYLADQSYALAGGGEIAPVPEPVGCILIAIAPTLLLRRRARRPVS
jgi:hypothetical protein